MSVSLCLVQVRKKDQINIESKLKNVRFIGKYQLCFFSTSHVLIAHLVCNDISSLGLCSE